MQFSLGCKNRATRYLLPLVLPFIQETTVYLYCKSKTKSCQLAA
jgi:hypothetical protein